MPDANAAHGMNAAPIDFGAGTVRPGSGTTAARMQDSAHGFGAIVSEARRAVLDELVNADRRDLHCVQCHALPDRDAD